MNINTHTNVNPSSPAPQNWGTGTSSPTPPLSEGEAGSGSEAGGASSDSPRIGGGGASTRVAARNATTHGLFARDVVLPHLGEDPRGYEALLSALAGQLQPKNMLEQHYVEKIAAASWRLRRLQRWQAQLFENPSITEDEALAKLDRVMRHETNLHRQIDTSIKMLAREIPKLFQDRMRALLMEDLHATEADCKEDPGMAGFIRRETLRRIPSSPIPEILKTAPLDTDARPLDDRREAPLASDFNHSSSAVSAPYVADPCPWPPQGFATEKPVPEKPIMENCKNEPLPLPRKEPLCITPLRNRSSESACYSEHASHPRRPARPAARLPHALGRV